MAIIEYHLLLSDCPPFGPETPWRRHLPFEEYQRYVKCVMGLTRQNTVVACLLIFDPEKFGGVGFEVPQTYLGDGESAIEEVFVYFEALPPSLHRPAPPPPLEGSVCFPPSDHGLDGVIPLPLPPESQGAWDPLIDPSSGRPYTELNEDIPPLSWAEQNRRINALLMRKREDPNETDPVL